MSNTLELMSQRAYAKHVGLSNEAIRLAIKDGRISKGWDAQEKKIIVAEADKEFGFQYRDITVDLTIPGGDDVISEGADSLDLKGSDTFLEARRKKEIILGKLSALDLKERNAELVQKTIVYEELFAFGQELRIAFMAIPDRVIDNILAASNRAESHGILTTAIHSVLQTITSKDFDFTPKK